MEQKEQVFLAALAGLLHDIGKFALRGGAEGASRSWDGQAEQDYKYKHALLSEDFAERYLPPQWQGQVKFAIGKHHRPHDRLASAVALADRLSAGERARSLSGEEKREQHPARLLSIFSDVSLDTPLAQIPQVYWPLRPLELSEKNVFPDEDKGSEVWKEYEKLYSGFVEQVEKLKAAYHNGGEIAFYLESLLAEMQQVLWCVPSAYYNNRPDISLYDHSRMTAALATALYDSPSLSDEQMAAFATEPEKVQDELVTLVGGDLTGVQSFLYTITARGAASGLRGRSFYLQLLGLVIARYVLDQLHLPVTSLIYAGGGNFYLIARREDAKKLPEIQAQVSRALFNEHQGELGLILQARLLRGRHFFNGEIRNEWDGLIGQINAAKLKRLEGLEADLARVFEPHGVGGSTPQQCAVCGREHSGVKPKPVDEGVEEKVNKCPVCESYEDLGKLLRKARYLVLQPVEGEPPAQIQAQAGRGWGAITRQFGYAVQVLEKLENEPTGILFALNDEAFARRQPGPQRATARYLLVNVTPILSEEEHDALRGKVDQLPVAGSVKPLNVLEAQAEGIKRLGVLRMDVDNLGKIFANGLNTRATLSRIASLSFAVSLFFEGWVGEIARQMNNEINKEDNEKNEKNERLYSIYSGGDDLFFVGSWDVVVEFALRLRRDLNRFTGGHPDIHPSGGIVLVGGKYPLYQAAEEAGNAEEQAKGYRRMKNGKMQQKDALSFLGQPLAWERFGYHECGDDQQDTAHALMHTLKNIVESDQNRALIRKLIRLHELYQEKVEERHKGGDDRNRAGQVQVLWGPWNWLAEYHLSRLKGLEKDDVEKIRTRLKQENFRSIEWIGLAARWAELITRKS
ncbi:MAG: type III-A CRISPR-associated protein Cas10/Csm1 [Chloroflexota bacterium]